MNINELEKLARAANPDEDWWEHGEGPKIIEPGMGGEDREFIAAANPSDILELIDRYKSVIRSLEAAANYIDTLDGNSLVIRQTISRANGESSV